MSIRSTRNPTGSIGDSCTAPRYTRVIMRSIAFLAALLAAPPAQALLIRADRDDAEYVELATRYPSSIELAPAIEGVLIAPRWVLTSAQAAVLLQGAKARPSLEIGGPRNAIKATFIHPDWRQGIDADLALVLLQEAVTGIEPTPISRDRDEIDEIVRIAGHGETGRLGDKARKRDGKKRGAINTVDRVTPLTLRLRLKPADEASDLQGAATPGEHGAPAFMEISRRISVAGIFSANDGDWQVFARVSSFAQWIDDTMYRAAVEEAATNRHSGRSQRER